MAVGADRSRVMRLVIREGVLMALAGVTIRSRRGAPNRDVKTTDGRTRGGSSLFSRL
jgi:hypothetical protein